MNHLMKLILLLSGRNTVITPTDGRNKDIKPEDNGIGIESEEVGEG